MRMTRESVEETIDNLWALHDEAKGSGEVKLADDYASQAFLLIETLPENAIYLKDLQ